MSTIKTVNHQIGTSTTPTQNFTLTAAALDGSMKLARGNSGATTNDVLTVTPAGVVKIPNNQVAFIAYASGGGQAATAGVTLAPIQFATKTYDVSNAFNAATGVFNPQVAGYYQINAGVNDNGAASGGYAFLYVLKNGVANLGYTLVHRGSTVGMTPTISYLVNLNGSTDTVTIGYNSSAATIVQATQGTFFQGFLVFPT